MIVGRIEFSQDAKRPFDTGKPLPAMTNLKPHREGFFRGTLSVFGPRTRTTWRLWLTVLPSLGR